ncbi:RskA family anti-sigma factor [Nocardia heshunensis]
MTADEPSNADLLELAYLYAMDAVTDLERTIIERRREQIDEVTAAAFDTIVTRVRLALAMVGHSDSCPPPPALEDRVLRAIDRHEAERTTVRGEPSDGAAPLGWLCAIAMVLIMLSTGVYLAYDGTVAPAAISAAPTWGS